jgi:hypothetical protein
MDHLVRRAIESEVKLAVRRSFESGLFASKSGPSHCHLMEYLTNDVSQFFWLRDMCNDVLEISERERLDGYEGHCFVMVCVKCGT